MTESNQHQNYKSYDFKLKGEQMTMKNSYSEIFIQNRLACKLVEQSKRSQVAKLSASMLTEFGNKQLQHQQNDSLRDLRIFKGLLNYPPLKSREQ